MSEGNPGSNDSIFPFIGTVIVVAVLPIAFGFCYEKGASDGAKEALIKRHLGQYVFDRETGEARFQEIIMATPADVRE